MSEIRMSGSRGDDQIGIGNFAVGSEDDAAVEIESGDLGHEDFNILI